MSESPLTLGTAGHVDHGKTALVSALTGTNTDRLAEERRRGISIELGYARLELPSGRALSVIDVPGHERFVRTMVAGATGIDLYLMTIAADDGVMPQTREHAAVLRALGVTRGVVAVTRTDLADPERAMIEAAELLPGAPAIPVCAPTGAGLAALREALDVVAGGVRSRAERGGPVRLHVDRVFTVRGAGTVVTGTLWSGSVAQGDELVLLPAARAARVRAVQVHDREVAGAGAGQRVAVNLAGIPVSAIERGAVLATPDSGLEPTSVLDAALDLGPEPPEHGDRVQIHHGTRDAPARLAWLGGRFWQVRLERPLIAAAGDRLVVRRIAPADTLGGGTVLDPHARKHGPTRDALARLTRIEKGEQADPGPPGSTEAGEEGDAWDSRKPARPGVPPADGAVPRSVLSPAQLLMEQRLRAAGLEPPPDSELDPDDLAALRAAGCAVRVSRRLHYHPDTIAAARERVIALAERSGGLITLAGVRDELCTSRRFAQALLEQLDAERVTIRFGEQRRLRENVTAADQASAKRSSASPLSAGDELPEAKPL
jgi:selenocysteine-specific elongation factor